MSVSLLTEHSEIEELGNGQIRQLLNLKPIAYRENGSLLAIAQNWEDSGDSARPHKVDRASIMVTAGENGMRRMHPTREIDRYIELGAPFVKTGGVWGQVNLGTPTRIGSRLQWTRPQANMYIDFGGHFVKLSILLKGGFVPEDRQIAFPVGMSGFTRQGGQLLRDGVVIAQLRSPMMIDFVNQIDTRPIDGQFVNVNGQPHWLMTLPDLTGMTQPVIDPTLSLQPDATAGKDTTLISSTATTNYETLTVIAIGEDSATASVRRGLIHFDLSSIPASAVVSSAKLSLYCRVDSSSNARTLRVFRQKRVWVENQATWNIYATSNNWQTAGGFGADDCEQTDIGSLAFVSNATLGIFYDWTLTASAVQEWISGAFANNGLLAKMDTETNDEYQFDSSDSTTASLRPKFEVIYTLPSAGTGFFRSPMWGRF